MNSRYRVRMANSKFLPKTAVSEGVRIEGSIGREYILYDLNEVIISGIVVNEQGVREKVMVDLN